jgi:DNA recombination protein RmuC
MVMLEYLYSLDLSGIEDFLSANALVLTCAAIGISGLLTALAALISSARSRNRAAGDEFAELKGRLSAMAELSVQQNAEQVRGLSERIDSLARNLSQALDTTAARLGENLNVTAARLGENLNATASRLGDSIHSTAARLGDNMSESERRTWESLSTLNERLALIDEANRSLTELSTEVGSLHGVLANKQARGAFGQMRMETIVRDGLPSSAYDFQPTLSNGKRPDCVIRLPNAEPLVVDSKFPLEGFEALRLAKSAEDTKLACASVREAVGRHVSAIEEKYLIPGETQDTALMFVPSESIYADLYEKFPDLVQSAHRARVMIVSPNTLMLAVHTVQALLKDAKMRDHADIIQREVGLLIADVAQLVERVSDLERHHALSGKALEKVTAATTRILARRDRLNILDLDAMAEPANVKSELSNVMAEPSNVTALAETDSASKRSRSR